MQDWFCWVWVGSVRFSARWAIIISSVTAMWSSMWAIFSSIIARFYLAWVTTIFIHMRNNIFIPNTAMSSSMWTILSSLIARFCCAVSNTGREGRSSVARNEDCAVKTNKIEAEEERKVSVCGRIFLFGCSHGVACEAVAKQSCRCHWNCREAWLFLLQAATGEQQAIHPERAYSTEMPRAFQATVLYSSRQVLSSKPSSFTPLHVPRL